MDDEDYLQSMQEMFVYPTQADAESVLKVLADGEERFRHSSND